MVCRACIADGATSKPSFSKGTDMLGRLVASIFGIIAVSLCLASPAFAFDWGPCDANVTIIEPSNVGTISTASPTTTAFAAVFFSVDQNVGTICSGSGTIQCPIGYWLYWAPRYFGGNAASTDASSPSSNEDIRQMANTKAILSTVQLALALGTKVRLYGFNKDTGGYCQLSNIHALNQ